MVVACIIQRCYRDDYGMMSRTEEELLKKLKTKRERRGLVEKQRTPSRLGGEAEDPSRQLLNVGNGRSWLIDDVVKFADKVGDSKAERRGWQSFEGRGTNSSQANEHFDWSWHWPGRCAT
mmetsp:Transcript_83999/g.271844  ORF Transcript_83999/g.271844 Transcript_83999/m.271844 type:complete len:120 (+) Transcript_83999:103-462(+)